MRAGGRASGGRARSVCIGAGGRLKGK